MRRRSLVKDRPVILTGVRTAAIRVMQQPALGAPALQRHLESLDRQMSIVGRADRPSDDENRENKSRMAARYGLLLSPMTNFCRVADPALVHRRRGAFPSGVGGRRVRNPWIALIGFMVAHQIYGLAWLQAKMESLLAEINVTRSAALTLRTTGCGFVGPGQDQLRFSVQAQDARTRALKYDAYLPCATRLRRAPNVHGRYPHVQRTRNPAATRRPADGNSWRPCARRGRCLTGWNWSAC